MMRSATSRTESARKGSGMALSETTVGVLIGAGATVGGSLVTGLLAFLVDSRRRRWEDRRTWDEVRQRSYASFHYTARQAIGAAGRLGAMATRMAKQEEDLEVAQSSGDELPERDPVLARLSEIVKADGEAVNVWGERLNEVSAEIDLIASRPVREAARAHFQVYADTVDLIANTVDKPMRSEELRARMVEFNARHAKTEEAFRHAVAEELRVEPRRWWQRQKQ